MHLHLHLQKQTEDQATVTLSKKDAHLKIEIDRNRGKATNIKKSKITMGKRCLCAHAQVGKSKLYLTISSILYNRKLIFL